MLASTDVFDGKGRRAKRVHFLHSSRNKLAPGPPLLPPHPACTAGGAANSGKGPRFSACSAPGHPFSLPPIHHPCPVPTASLQTVKFLVSNFHLCPCSALGASLSAPVTSTGVWGRLPRRASEPTSWFILWKGLPPHPPPAGFACVPGEGKPFPLISGPQEDFLAWLAVKNTAAFLSQKSILSIYKNVQCIWTF